MASKFIEVTNSNGKETDFLKNIQRQLQIIRFREFLPAKKVEEMANKSNFANTSGKGQWKQKFANIFTTYKSSF